MENIVQVEVTDKVAEIVINRPKSLNALNRDVLSALLDCFLDLDSQNIVAAVLSGAGDKAFVAGADVAQMQELNRVEIGAYIELGQRVMRAIELVKFPVIAAVDGFALGGGLELALACDLICADPKSKFGAPEVNLGIIPGFGGTQRLIQRCGIGTARRLVFTGDMVTAQEAKDLGLVDLVSEAGQLAETTRGIINSISSKGPLAISEAKKVIARSQEAILLSGLKLEVESFMRVFETEDRKEGMGAFLEKRKANFSSR